MLHTSPAYVNAPVEFLKENNVTEWADLPIWTGDEFDLVLDNSKLLNDFKTQLSTFTESVEKTIAYFDTLGWNEGKYGLRAEREKELIKTLSAGK